MKVNTTSGWIIAAILAGAVLLAHGCSDTGALGTYQSVSESEWNVTLELKTGQIAIITQEEWLPGEYDSREITITEGGWEQRGDTVLLAYSGVVDTLTVDANLSLSALGLEGGAPGLEQRTSIAPASIIRTTKLWKLPHNF